MYRKGLKSNLMGILFNLFKLVLAAIISIFLLSIIVYFYDFSGVHIKTEHLATDYSWEPYQIVHKLDEGLAYVKMDQNGYNNLEYPCIDVSDYIIMGSSQMESFNVAQTHNTTALLNKLYNINAYNIGISGHTFYHCLNNFENAIERFTPQTGVVIVTDDIWLNTDNMNTVLKGEWEHIKSYDSGIIFMLQKKIPAIKALYKKVTDWRNAEIQASITIKSPLDKEYCNYLYALLGNASYISKENDIRLYILYQPRTKISADGCYIRDSDAEAINVFSSICEEFGITFVDMTDPFERLYNEQHILAHGFANTAVGYGHLNKYGHAIIAEKLASVLQGVEE